MDLISELKRKQQKEPLIYESDRDGAIEDIITGESLVRSLSCVCFQSLLCPPRPAFLPILRGLLPPPASSLIVKPWLAWNFAV